MKKKVLRYLALLLVPPIGAMLIKLIYLTSRKKFNLPKPLDEKSVVFAFWHGDLLLAPYIYYQLRSTPNANVLISDHFDGKIIASIMRYFRLGTIHGSSNKNAAKVLINAMKTLKNGQDIGITPDGPKGPRCEVADGIIIMAKKTSSKIICFNSRPSTYWRLKSWDRFVIAKPFSSIEFFASEPIDVSDLELEEARALIKKELMKHAL
ncbi:MAG: lysophospholipid acyltransferase family protein [Campylobacterota bacterium]|nr:lysophospholipid acyltransferase family protein [Campylobacterota bacterium]